MLQEIVNGPIQEGGIEELKELIAGKIGTAAKLKLFKSSFSPSQTSVNADFVASECDFVGYLGKALTMGTPGLDSDGHAVSYSGDSIFTATDATTPNSVGGCWIEVETATTPSPVYAPYRYFQFPNPIPMASALATLSVTVAMQSPGQFTSVIVDS